MNQIKRPLIVFFTGAGISKPSGIPTFRDGEDGLWNNHPISEVATMSAFRIQPQVVLDFFYNLNLTLIDKKPNKAHYVIAELEKDYEVVVITQNIDTLHEQAGSTNVIHLHGKHDEMKCLDCYFVFPYDFHNKWHYGVDKCPHCQGTNVKNNIVLFQEPLSHKNFERAEILAYHSDVFIQIGTSALVSPANTLIKRALPRRKRVEMNLVKSCPKNPYLFQHYYLGNIINTIDFLNLDLPKMLPKISRTEYLEDEKDKNRYDPNIKFYRQV